jgi:hypothetical protein
MGCRRLKTIKRSFTLLGLGIKLNIEEQTGRDGRLITTPSQLNGLGMKCQSFQRDVGTLIWDFIVENYKDGNDDDNKDDNNSEDNKDNKDHKKQQRRGGQRRLLTKDE